MYSTDTCIECCPADGYLGYETGRLSALGWAGHVDRPSADKRDLDLGEMLFIRFLA